MSKILLEAGEKLSESKADACAVLDTGAGIARLNQKVDQLAMQIHVGNSVNMAHARKDGVQISEVREASLQLGASMGMPSKVKCITFDASMFKEVQSLGPPEETRKKEEEDRKRRAKERSVHMSGTSLFESSESDEDGGKDQRRNKKGASSAGGQGPSAGGSPDQAALFKEYEEARERCKKLKQKANEWTRRADSGAGEQEGDEAKENVRSILCKTALQDCSAETVPEALCDAYVQLSDEVIAVTFSEMRELLSAEQEIMLSQLNQKSPIHAIGFPLVLAMTGRYELQTDLKAFLIDNQDSMDEVLQAIVKPAHKDKVGQFLDTLTK